MIAFMLNLSLKTLQITGQDAATFLQNLMTCDVSELKNGPLLAAVCNQKGRIIANFWIWQEDDDFYLQLPDSMAAVLMVHLKKYVFRSKVAFEYVEKQPSDHPHFMPIWIYPETTEQFTPQMIGLEKHGGVSFKKGCYLGQEIIARTQHLGKLKRHLYTLTLGKTVAANIGDEITDDQGQKIGTIAAISGKEIFAVIEDRAIETPLYWKAHLLK